MAATDTTQAATEAKATEAAASETENGTATKEQAAHRYVIERLRKRDNKWSTYGTRAKLEKAKGFVDARPEGQGKLFRVVDGQSGRTLYVGKK